MTPAPVTRGQLLGIALAAAAALLLLGRGATLLYADHAWYAALGATSVWEAKVIDSAVMYGMALVLGTAFAMANITAVRQSVLALILPTRLANVEIGEEIPSRRLRVVAWGMSLLVALVATLALPRWTTVSLLRSHVTFNEADPYFGMDLGDYVAWVPAESAAYVWALVLFSTVVLLVVTMYALTPNLRWGRDGIHVTTHARRHITVLATLLVLFLAWNFRLDAYDTLIHGSGPGGLFTRLDHRWVVPTDLACSIVAVGAAVVLLAAGWVGHTYTALLTVTVVMLGALVAKLVLPWAAGADATNPARASAEVPYVTTQRLYTARAFPPEAPPLSTRFAADSSLIAAAPRLGVQGREPLLGSAYPDVVYPGARGVIMEGDPAGIVRAPHISTTAQKVVYAWVEQNPRLARAVLPPQAVIVRRRDVRRRVSALAPIFLQSRQIGARPTVIGVVWIVDLYAASIHYPLSAERVLGGRRVNYTHHAATAYVSGTTGAVAIVPDSVPEPIARAWFASHPGAYLLTAMPREVAQSIATSPSSANAPTAGSDSAFRANVIRLYTRMRAALDSGDFRAFGDAFDSLGATIGVRK